MRFGTIQLSVVGLKDTKQDAFDKLVTGHVEDKSAAWEQFQKEAEKYKPKKADKDEK